MTPRPSIVPSLFVFSDECLCACLPWCLWCWRQECLLWASADQKKRRPVAQKPKEKFIFWGISSSYFIFSATTFLPSSPWLALLGIDDYPHSSLPWLTFALRWTCFFLLLSICLHWPLSLSLTLSSLLTFVGALISFGLCLCG